MTRVFVSYSHDDDAHVASVCHLAEQLAEWDGLNVTLDLWADNPPKDGRFGWSKALVRDRTRDRVPAPGPPDSSAQHQLPTDTLMFAVD